MILLKGFFDLAENAVAVSGGWKLRLATQIEMQIFNKHN